ncbi:MAG: hypothetical protein M3298_08530 [Thermoproteota archaeon]|jgi:hypothetical protein|nr:hypothetical protein [Thermoproteota archaeon]MDQ3808198.1 hypothetical protein [Thermoproteota archaeon]
MVLKEAESPIDNSIFCPINNERYVSCDHVSQEQTVIVAVQQLPLMLKMEEEKTWKPFHNMLQDRSETETSLRDIL